MNNRWVKQPPFSIFGQKVAIYAFSQLKLIFSGILLVKKILQIHPFVRLWTADRLRKGLCHRGEIGRYHRIFFEPDYMYADFIYPTANCNLSTNRNRRMLLSVSSAWTIGDCCSLGTPPSPPPCYLLVIMMVIFWKYRLSHHHHHQMMIMM